MKSQAYAQVLVYIFTIVLVSIILIYGYNSIRDFRGQAEEVSMLKFKNDISNFFIELEPEYESRKTRSFNLPEGIKEICFINTYIDAITDFNGVDSIMKDIIETENSIDDRKKVKNVFLLEDTLKESFNIPVSIDIPGDSTPSNHILCISAVAGRVTLKIKGKGDGIEISKE